MRVLIKDKAKETLKESFLRLSICDFKITVPLNQNKKISRNSSNPLQKQKINPFFICNNNMNA